MRTPLYDWHVAHGARMVDFGGWDMPIQYTTITEEHTAVRTAAGLFDISHMGRLSFGGAGRAGPDPARLHQRCRHDEGRPGPLRPDLQRAGRHPRRRAGLSLALRLGDGRQRLATARRSSPGSTSTTGRPRRRRWSIRR